MTNEEKIKELVDEPFLSKLTTVARLLGWGVSDYIEVKEFLRELHYIKNVPVPDLEPIEEDEEGGD